MRRKDEKFATFNFDSLWTGYSSNRCGLYLLSQRDIAIITPLLRYASWGTRWLGGNDPVWPRDLLANTGRLADLEEALQYVEDLTEVLMSDCGSTFGFDGLKAIADAIAAKACANTCEVNIIQGLTGEGLLSYGSETPSTGAGDPEGDPPEGFDTWEDYYTHKCQVANTLADGLISTFRNLGLVNLVNLVGASVLVGAALGGFIVVPPAAIAILIGAIVALGLSYSVLKDIGDYFAENRDDLVCGLYNADDQAAAVDFFSGLLDEALAALVVASELHPAIRTIALVLASTDTLNRLFDANLQISYPDADCSSCEPAATNLVFTEDGFGELISGSLTLTEDESGDIVIQGTADPASNLTCGIKLEDSGEFIITHMECVSGDCDANNNDGYDCNTAYQTGWSYSFINTYTLCSELFNFRCTGTQKTIQVKFRARLNI